jgi:DNA-binding GntR family transcriptional regulator
MTQRGKEKAPSMADVVFSQIEEAILNGNLASGELLTENVITDIAPDKFLVTATEPFVCKAI